MAIYKNREVSVGALTPQSNMIEQVNIKYQDGTSENVKVSEVKFTKDEKQNLQKTYPSSFDDITPVSDDDVKAVRLGVAPSFDREAAEKAKTNSLREAAQKADQDMQDKRKKEADKEVDSKVNSPTGAK